MVKLHLSIWMNIKTLLNYGKRSGRFSCWEYTRLFESHEASVLTNTGYKIPICGTYISDTLLHWENSPESNKHNTGMCSVQIVYLEQKKKTRVLD
jgi:hypothetical protein